MNSSPTLAKFAPAFLKAQQDITHAEKKADNPFFKSKYADLPTVIAAIKPALNENGISFLQLPCEGPNGTLTLTTILMHESGEWISGTGSCPLLKQDPQAFGSAMTYFRRYTLAGATGLFQSDDDGNEASGHPQPQQTPKKAVETPAKATPASDMVHRGTSASTSLDPAGAGWRDVQIHFGKNKGKSLGELSDNTISWYAEKWTPKPYGSNTDISDNDKALLAAVQAWQAEESEPAEQLDGDPQPF